MNRKQKVAIVVALANIALIVLFPPFDFYSIGNSQLPIFGGFDLVLTRSQNQVVNTPLLILELLVVLINVCIAWLLLQTLGPEPKPRITLQRAALIAVAINLVVIVLFPPFESIYAVTKATLPTFEGFRFIFTRQPHHVIVTALLYIEAIFVVVNGALFWLIFLRSGEAVIRPDQARKLIEEIRRRDS